MSNQFVVMPVYPSDRHIEALMRDTDTDSYRARGQYIDLVASAADHGMVAVRRNLIDMACLKLETMIDLLEGDGVAMAECQRVINELREALSNG